MEPLNLLVTIDKNYLEPLRIMLRSYSQTHEGIFTNVFIAHSTLSENDFKSLEKSINDKNIILRNVPIIEKRFNEIPVLERLGAESFYRILAFDFLPKEITRCLYLDPDIIIKRSLLPLYFSDLNDCYFAAASHIKGLNNFFNRIRLNLKTHTRYVNSGVMLMNLKEIRKDFTTDEIFACLKRKARILIMGDQDLCNILFGKKMLLLDELLYNLDERTYRRNKKSFNLTDVSEKTAIIHYNGKYKPWLNGYKGVLNRYYPEVEKCGKVKKFNAFARSKAIFCILLSIKRKNKKDKAA